MKTNPGNFFEDFALGQTLVHATPRTVSVADGALYMALTGELPFRVKSSFAIGAIYKKKLTNSFETPRQLNADVSERVSNAVCRALRADRAERLHPRGAVG